MCYCYKCTQNGHDTLDRHGSIINSKYTIGRLSKHLLRFWWIFQTRIKDCVEHDSFISNE